MKRGARINFSSVFVFLLIVILFAVFVSAVSWTTGSNRLTYIVTEDTPYYHNFTANITDPAADMVFAVDTLNTNITWNGAQVNYSEISDWIYFTNSTTGIFILNATLDNQTGNFTIPIKVAFDGGTSGATASFYFNISLINDPPKFQNLGGNRTLYKSKFDLILYATDEESDNNFTYNITVKTCPDGTSNCQLFNFTYFNDTAINLSFTPTVIQNGTYEINFSVMDNRSSSYYSEYWNWTVIWNYDPYFTYVCDNERNSAVENTEFTCWINASDQDETTSLNFTANYTWFTFNGTTLSNTITIPISNTNASALVNFTANDSMVGRWLVNISVRDSAAGAVGINSTLIYFNVSNVNDSVYLHEIANLTSYNSSTFNIYFNASDDDNLIPDKGFFNETLVFSTNNSNFSFVSREVISGTNITQATFTFNGTQMGVGNHTVNVWVNDSNSFSSSSKIFTIQILANSLPVWGIVDTNYSLVEDTSFYLNLISNVTDADAGDTITFSHTNDTSFASFSINSTTAVINFTPKDEDVGHHLVTIIATDGKTPISLTFNFTVNNTADNPIIEEPLSSSPDANIGATSNMNITKNTASTITLEAWDGDLAIPSGQSSFYSENITLNLTIAGPDTALFTFGNSLAIAGKANKTRFIASFTPTTTGDYNITINISDATNRSDLIRFNLSVSEAATTVVTTPTPSSGGGGATLPVSLKIIMPGPVSSKKRDKIILPVQLYNSGKVALNNIVVSGTIAKDGILRTDILASFDQSRFTSLAIGERKNLTLIIDVNTEEMGLYEVTLNATVKSPSYTDWGKIYLTVEEGEKVEEKLVFTEEYIVGNPECAELKELVDEAKDMAERGDREGAARKLDEALEACKMAISQVSVTGRAIARFEENAIGYTAIGSLIAGVLGFLYYQYRRIKLKREVLTGVKENIS